MTSVKLVEFGRILRPLASCDTFTISSSGKTRSHALMLVHRGPAGIEVTAIVGDALGDVCPSFPSWNASIISVNPRLAPSGLDLQLE